MAGGQHSWRAAIITQTWLLIWRRNESAIKFNVISNQLAALEPQMLRNRMAKTTWSRESWWCKWIGLCIAVPLWRLIDVCSLFFLLLPLFCLSIQCVHGDTEGEWWNDTAPALSNYFTAAIWRTAFFKNWSSKTIYPKSSVRTHKN